MNVRHCGREPDWYWYLHSSWGGCDECEAQAQAQLLNMLQSWQSDLNLGQSQRDRKVRNKDGEERGGKMTVTQGGTRTRNLANGLLCSNQLSYRVTRNSVAEFEYLRLSYKGSSWSRYQAGTFDGEGAVRVRVRVPPWVTVIFSPLFFSPFFLSDFNLVFAAPPHLRACTRL